MHPTTAECKHASIDSKLRNIWRSSALIHCCCLIQVSRSKSKESDVVRVALQEAAGGMSGG